MVILANRFGVWHHTHHYDLNGNMLCSHPNPIQDYLLTHLMGIGLVFLFAYFFINQYIYTNSKSKK